MAAMIPSLVSCCLQLLVPFADEIELPVALRLRPHDTLLDDLVPDPAELDPKLWAVLIQVYETLPPYFRTLTLPLTSSHVSLLQGLAPSPNFSLITLLTLSACPDLTDESILLFKGLHTLVGLDASCTCLTSHAIYTLGAILQHDYGNDAVRHHRGPWELRILSLRNCKQINDDVYPYLNKFPLLAVVDLRGTQCKPLKDSPFQPCSLSTLHHPMSMVDSMAELQSVQTGLFLSNRPYILKVDKIKLPQVHRRHVPDVAPQNAFVVVPANPYRPVKVGNTHVLELQKQRAEERDKHERNKEAWYERQERLEESEFDMADYDYFGYDNDAYSGSTGGYPASGEDSDTGSRNEYNPNLSTSMKRPRRLCVPRLHANNEPVYQPGRNPYLLARDASAIRSLPSPRFGAPEYRTILRPNPIPHLSTTMNSTPRARALNPNHPTRDVVVGPPSTNATPSSSSTASFYSRLLPPMPKLKAKPLLLRAVEEGDPTLKLYREPPPYSDLSSALGGSSKRARASGDNNEQGDEPASERPSHESLKQAAKVDQTGTRAERARHAMQLAVQNRMSSVQSSSKTPFNRPDLAPDESVLKKRRNVVPSFESSFPPESNTAARARNPFRKSLPSQSVLGGFMDPPIFDSKPHQAVDSKASYKKAAHRHSLGNTALTISTARHPSLKPSKSTTDMRSSDFSTSSTSTFTTAKVGYRPPPRPASPPNTKPLVPISSIKIPILPEPLRKEVAAMEKAEIEKIKRAAERKRKKREEEEEGDATDEDEAELKRALKKRASLAKIGAGAKKDGRGGDASTSGTKIGERSGSAQASTSKGKRKGKVSTGKKGAFDWTGWAKK